MTGQSGDRSRRAITVLAGIMLMLAVVLIAFGVLSRFAGGWGVPFFSFTTTHGGTCTNTFTGFRCDRLTPADVGYYADLEVPADATVVSARYVTTHDYTLDATLTMTPASAAGGLANAKATFGACRDRPSPLPADVKTDCVMTNTDYTAQADGDQASRIYTVASGLRPDGTRVLTMSIKSR